MNAEQILAIVMDGLKAEGAVFTADVVELRAYAAERARHLATVVGEPGFDQALAAERDAVALKAGIVAVAHAEGTDMRLLGMLQAGLLVVAQILAAPAPPA